MKHISINMSDIPRDYNLGAEANCHLTLRINGFNFGRKLLDHFLLWFLIVRFGDKTHRTVYGSRWHRVYYDLESSDRGLFVGIVICEGHFDFIDTWVCCVGGRLYFVTRILSRDEGSGCPKVTRYQRWCVFKVWVDHGWEHERPQFTHFQLEISKFSLKRWWPGVGDDDIQWDKE